MSDSIDDLYLDYYKNINISEDFYWVILKIPAEDIHIMTDDEMKKYNIIYKYCCGVIDSTELVH